MAGTVMIGGGAGTGALAYAGAPWSVVAVVAVFGIVVPGLIILMMVLFPTESEHKRDIWMAFVRFWDQRGERRRKDREDRRCRREERRRRREERRRKDRQERRRTRN
ncbi:hypothetical protein [Streptomyces sp. NPDC051909]|uniref:hypothetical protein n=1 Tax=Streptomyces sp. NPDC051909 TaxID=3154944 RepID=UPI003413D6CE